MTVPEGFRCVCGSAGIRSCGEHKHGFVFLDFARYLQLQLQPQGR